MSYFSSLKDRSGAIVNIPYDHHEIHEGSHFFAKDYIRDFATGANDTKYLYFKTPSDKEIHAYADFAADAEFIVCIYEDADVTGGSAMTNVFNNNREIGTAPALGVYTTPTTITSKGDLIWRVILGAGKTSGGVSNLSSEIITKKSCTYLFEITKVPTGTTHYIDYNFYWYENGS